MRCDGCNKTIRCGKQYYEVAGECFCESCLHERAETGDKDCLYILEDEQRKRKNG